ncbi:rhodanese-like domain-containing protein [Flavihumibacter profundi]|jgi:rhodanese-related sulfurtransferase|uniref:rhodanese-like domain-containing protein n=1 Tax=Flavihumibacter profundi TaxID=2716883 RepID=UPI001CC59E31|nr:rhodanese-like domain-containing protein [Flavihumibacter profundi]MBZ5856288.1 rhodanese-like domain-containing protein [Flavihumibacter profundi]
MPEAFEQKVKQPGAQILDVRTAEEFKSGYIAGALQADWLKPEEFSTRSQDLDALKEVLIYCASGKRSAYAAQTLRSKR